MDYVPWVSVSWMIAEHLWNVEEIILHKNPFPSNADIFYVSGCVFLILFSLHYVKIVKNAITKKMIMLSVFSSIALLIPSLCITIYENSDVSGIVFLLAFM